MANDNETVGQVALSDLPLAEQLRIIRGNYSIGSGEFDALDEAADVVECHQREIEAKDRQLEAASADAEAAKMREAPEEQMERIVRDAILSYEQLYRDAPNDDSEREIIERCAIANGWLVSNGFARQAVSFDKEESPNL